MSKLALNGGDPIVPKKLQKFHHPVVDPSLFEKMQEQDYQDKVIAFDSELVSQLQDAFKTYLGCTYVLATNSGTSALFEMFYAAGLCPGDEVIVPCYTFFSTATPLFVLRCIPVLADCTANGNIDPEDIRKKITKKTKAICVTHMWGIPCDMDEIQKIAKAHNLILLEDSSHAHGATYGNKIVGTIGDASAWSLGTKKLLTGGQGGILGTNDSSIYQKAILVGHANNKRINDINLKELLPYSITGTGLNLRIHPFAAAVLLQQLESFPKQLEERRATAAYMTKRVQKISGLRVAPLSSGENPAWYAFPILYNEIAFRGISKEKFVEALVAEGAVEGDIPHSTCPLTEFDIFRQRQLSFSSYNTLDDVYHPEDFPRSLEFQRDMFKLPTWYGGHHMEYAEAYMDALTKVAENIDEIKK